MIAIARRAHWALIAIWEGLKVGTEAVLDGILDTSVLPWLIVAYLVWTR